MSRIDLASLVQEIGPQCAEGAEARDRSASFVAENYDLLKRHKAFSALVPQEFGGGGGRHGEMCAFLRALAGTARRRRWRCRCTSTSSRPPW